VRSKSSRLDLNPKSGRAATPAAADARSGPAFPHFRWENQDSKSVTLIGSASNWCVPTHLVENFSGRHALLSYRKGSTIFPQGSLADVMYWVKSGLVNVYWTNADGVRILVRLAGGTEMLGYAQSIDKSGQAIHVFEAQARTNCQIALITREHLRRIFQNLDKDTLVDLIVHLNNNWSAAAVQWAAFMTSDCRQRLALVLIDIASRFGANDVRGTLLISELSHQDFADMVGCSRQMTTRIIDEMTKVGVLARHDGHYILLHDRKIEPHVTESAAIAPAHSTNSLKLRGDSKLKDTKSFAEAQNASEGHANQARQQTQTKTSRGAFVIGPNSL
jgi:CRP-like cAMP-binding protein